MSVVSSLSVWERARVSGAWQPAVDVYETRGGVSVTIELPGVSPNDVAVRFVGDMVLIEGQRTMPVLDGRGIFHAAEIRRGPFRLEIHLPAAVDTDRLEMRADLGLMFIQLTKSDNSHGR
ncbi:MAG TPA: Hsp20/alpha crystallin family protein [Chloroflexota bacterium]|jgi:HSP20 family protein|nr:Hsp20/alpha crystallin family protein [Chloroflexota bacterium]